MNTALRETMHQHKHFPWIKFLEVSKFLEVPFYGCVDYANLVEDWFLWKFFCIDFNEYVEHWSNTARVFNGFDLPWSPPSLEAQ